MKCVYSNYENLYFTGPGCFLALDNWGMSSSGRDQACVGLESTAKTTFNTPCELL